MKISKKKVNIMKKKIKGNKLLIIILLLLVLAGFALYQLLPIWMMSPAETGIVADTNIYAVKNNMNNVFFIETENGFIMIDAGSETGSIEQHLNDENIRIKDVKWILLTHSDYDHVEALSLFPNAQVYMNEDELSLVNGSVKRNAGGGNSLPITTDGIILLQDRQQLIFDEITVDCIKSPGHTIGSMSYLINQKYLFTGDSFRINNEKPEVHPFSMNKESSLKTIKALKEIVNNSEIIITSHYGYYKGLRFT